MLVHERNDDIENAMGRRNWSVVLPGVFVFFLGLLLMIFVDRNHHGVLGFLAPFSLITGLALCVIGMTIKSLPPGASS